MNIYVRNIDYVDPTTFAIRRCVIEDDADKQTSLEEHGRDALVVLRR